MTLKQVSPTERELRNVLRWLKKAREQALEIRNSYLPDSEEGTYFDGVQHGFFEVCEEIQRRLKRMK